MNIYDSLIIYLTCGAPFAVYYFLQHRSVFNSKQLWLKTILNFLFWMPLAYRFALKNRILRNGFERFFAKETSSDSNIEKDLLATQRKIEKIILKNAPDISIYELRETLARYSGLTLACQNENKMRQSARYKFFQIAEHNNSKLAEICFERRNRKRLSHHQIQARRDFLKIFADSFEACAETEKLGQLMLEFATFLDDATAQNALQEMFKPKAQSNKAWDVKNARKDLWKLEPPRPSTINSTTNHLKVLTATATKLSSKD